MWDCCFCAIGWSKVGNSGCLSSPSCVKTVYGRQNGQEWYSQYDCYFLLPFLNRKFPNHDHCGQSWSSSYKNSYPCLILTYRRPWPSIFFTTAKLYSVHGPCSMGEIFFCLTFTNSKSFDPINGNLFERDSLIADCLIASSLSFSFNDSIPFAITEPHFMFSCLSSADFKMANSTTFLSPLSLVCCCFLGTDLAHAYTCQFGYGSDLILWEWLSLLKTPVLWLVLFMLLPYRNTSEMLITIIHRWWGCR